MTIQKYVEIADATKHNHLKGDWITATIYSVGDIVQNGGASYYCKLAHTSSSGNEPGTGGSWTDYWDVFTQGTPGEKGEKGDKGDTGNPGTMAERGVWSSPISYILNDLVQHAKSGCGLTSYICILAHTSGASSEPEIGGSWTTYWDEFAGGGLDGEGSGDVVGPGSATDSHLVEFDTATGKLIKDGGLTHADAADAISEMHTQASDDNFHGLDAVTSLVDADELLAYVIGSSLYKKITKSNLIGTAITNKDSLYYNLLINGSFEVNQRAITQYTSATTPANSDDTYLHDQYTLLSDGNDIVDVYHDTIAADLPPGGSACVKFEVETANKKFGYIQLIESKDAIKYAGKYCSLQFKAKTTTGKVINNVRAAVLSWSSTADAVTSDVVSAWGGQGTNPTLVANWTAENVAANLALTASWQTFKIENIAIDTASMTNLAIFIWVDDTDCAVDDLLYITEMQLNEGEVCLPYSPKPFLAELQNCRRFYWKNIAGAAYYIFSTGFDFDATNAYGSFAYPTRLRAAPSALVAVGDFQIGDGSGQTVTSLSLYMANQDSIGWHATVASGLTAGRGCILQSKNNVASYLEISVEL